MAIISNKNIQTVQPTQVASNPVQNQEATQQPTANVGQPIQVPLQMQPVVQAPATQPTTTQNVGVQTTNAQMPNVVQQVPEAQNNVPQQPTTTANNSNTTQTTPSQNTVVNAPTTYQKSNQNVQQQPITTQSTTTGKISVWTPIKITNTDITTNEGQYQSAYANTISELVNSILNSRFEYNPEEDDLLQLATKYSTQQTFESMNARGILNSSMTGERVAKVIADLTYQYQQLAREDFEREFNRMLNVANVIMTLDNTEYQRWIDDRNYKYQLKKDEYEKHLQEIQEAWNRVDTLGYVDNSASLLVGLPVGTLSKEARQRMEAKQDEIELYQKKLEMQQKADLELYQIKSAIDAQYEWNLYNKKSELDYKTQLSLYNKKSQMDYANELELYRQKSAIDTSNYETKTKIDAMYSNKTNSNKASDYSSEISKYDSILQNSYATKNSNNQYAISYNKRTEVLNYLKNEQQAGRLSDYTALYLIQKYSLANSAKQDRDAFVAEMDARIAKEKKK